MAGTPGTVLIEHAELGHGPVPVSARALEYYQGLGYSEVPTEAAPSDSAPAEGSAATEGSDSEAQGEDPAVPVDLTKR